LKLGLGCGADDFFADMILVLVNTFDLFGLEVERLTLAAAFFFISLCPCGQNRNSSKQSLWKSASARRTFIPKQIGLLGEVTLYTAET
jgi:hypothetical protein